MTTTPDGPVITCQQCKGGTMVATKVPRMSSGVRFLGYTLLVPSIFVLLTSAACGILVTGAGGVAGSEAVDDTRQMLVSNLRESTIPTSVIDDFAEDGNIDDEQALGSLSASDRATVDAAVSAYNASLTGAAVGGAAATGIAGATVVVLWFIFLPTLIVGGLLLLNKNVWKCPTCGYIFERA